jgi:uncharacterized protein YndB with AHSA1/START domain
MTNTLNVSTPSDHEILMTRDFDAPRNLVFDCWTKPELLARWMLGPDGWSFAVCEIDFRVGGAYHFVWRSTAGEEMGMSGVYQEIVPSERIVNTESYDQDPTGGEALVTAIFTEHAGKTTVKTIMRFGSKEIRDAVINTGMEHGVAASYDRLDAYFQSIESSAQTREAAS